MLNRIQSLYSRQLHPRFGIFGTVALLSAVVLLIFSLIVAVVSQNAETKELVDAFRYTHAIYLVTLTMCFIFPWKQNPQKIKLTLVFLGLVTAITRSLLLFVPSRAQDLLLHMADVLGGISWIFFSVTFWKMYAYPGSMLSPASLMFNEWKVIYQRIGTWGGLATLIGGLVATISLVAWIMALHDAVYFQPLFFTFGWVYVVGWLGMLILSLFVKNFQGDYDPGAKLGVAYMYGEFAVAWLFVSFAMLAASYPNWPFAFMVTLINLGPALQLKSAHDATLTKA